MKSGVVCDDFTSFSQDLEDQLFQSQRSQKKIEKDAANRQAQEEKIQVTLLQSVL